MLTTLDGTPITEHGQPPPVGHSMREAAQPLVTKGSTSPGGDSMPSVEASPYTRFMARRLLQDKLLQKATANDQLADRMRRRLDVVDTYLSDEETLFRKLEKASIWELSKMEGEYIEKLQLLTGQATQIIGASHHEKIDTLLPTLMELIKQRGLTVTATQNTLKMTAPADVVGAYHGQDREGAHS